ncbi:hypothetical protein [Cyanobium sp. ATX-6F1]|uniref:hypothetical protein n=1 Tax=Cyanobium sp. ATX-6F1 TaxID=3137388 RepID=UPI0039BE8586
MQLARAGVPVTLIEAAKEFSRQFRGRSVDALRPGRPRRHGAGGAAGGVAATHSGGLEFQDRRPGAVQRR